MTSRRLSLLATRACLAVAASLALAVGAAADAGRQTISIDYPGCRDVRVPTTRTPLLILIGDKDDWTPAESCRQFAAAARAAGRPVTLVVYPDAQHHFDGAHLRERRVIAAAKGGQGATIEYNAAAHADAEKQVKEFLAAHMTP